MTTRAIRHDSSVGDQVAPTQPLPGDHDVKAVDDILGALPAGMPPDHHDVQLARRGLRRIREDKQATNQELAAIKRIREAQEDEVRWRHYRSVPQRHYAEMSGLSPKSVLQQAATYGFPVQGRVIDLAAVVAHLHRFLTENAASLRGYARRAGLGTAQPGADENAEASSDERGSSDERLTLARARLKEMEVAQRMGLLIDREAVRRGMNTAAARLREAAIMLQRQYGADAGVIIEEALEEIERKMREMLSPPVVDEDGSMRESAEALEQDAALEGAEA